MARGLKIAVLAPTLQGFGGLERYLLDFALASAKVASTTVISTHTIDFQALEKAFDRCLDVEGIGCKVDPRCDPRTGGWLQRYRAGKAYAALTKEFDLVVASSWLTPWRQAAPRSIYICHFPMVTPSNRLQGGSHSLLSAQGRQQRELRQRLESWSTFVTSSEFGQQWLRTYWARESTILIPGVGVESPRPTTSKKPWILGCGFFGRPYGGYSFKRQELLIEIFGTLYRQGFLEDWQLHLAGHVLPGAESEQVLEGLRTLADGLPVVLHPNCPSSELLELYQGSRFFWHATGFGVEEPSAMEHFGIVTVEAMSWGCIPLVFAGGGQREIVEPEVSGFWWSSKDEFLSRMVDLLSRQHELTGLSERARERATKYSPSQFEHHAQALLRRELELLS